MILVDYNQVSIAGISQEFMRGGQDQFSPELARHFILNSIRALNVKFRNDYGELIICADGGNVWRRDYFTNYKAARRAPKPPKEEKIWQTTFDVMGNTLSEFTKFFPYNVLRLRGVEADDIIAYMARTAKEPVVIVSSDKDFAQLHRYDNVKQYSPTKKEFITVDDPESYIWEMIATGDSGDGVPNILSDDDVFIDPDRRQKPFTGLFKKEWMTTYFNRPDEFFDDIESGTILKKQAESISVDQLRKNYKRNKTMVDLIAGTPNDVTANIADHVGEEFAREKPTFSQLMFYLVSIDAQTLIDKIGDFKNKTVARNEFFN